MSGNATYRFTNTSVLAVCAIDAPVVVTSAEIDERLAGDLPSGSACARDDAAARRHPRAPLVARGTSASPTAPRWPARRRWPRRASTPAEIGLMINTSVSRAHLEPSTAVRVHHALGLPARCLNFDVANACLGFVNGMQLAAAMIDAGQIDYALVVNGEDARDIHDVDRSSGCSRRRRRRAGRARASSRRLTLGSGAAAMVLGRADQHPEGHRFLGGVDAGRHRAPRAVRRRHGLHAHRHAAAAERRAGAVRRDLWRRPQADFDWARHGPLHHAPGLAGAHQRDVEGRWTSTRPGSR